MTLKKSISLGSGFVILLTVIVAISYGYMMVRLSSAQNEENTILKDRETLQKGSLELNVWMDQMEQHVLEGWPFEGELDHSKTSHVNFVNTFRPNSSEEKKIVAEIVKNHERLHETAAKIVQTGDKDLKMDIYIDEFKPAANALAPLMGGISNSMNNRLYHIRTDRINLQNKTGYFIVASCLLIIGVITLAIVFLFKKVLGPIAGVSENIQSFGEGNLDVSVQYHKNDEIGDIARNFNKMVTSFNLIINGILTSSDRVVSAVGVLKQKANESSKGASAQREQSEQAATASEEMSQTIVDISKNASTASEASNEAMKIADEGKKVSIGAVETMNSVHASTQDLSTMVEQLNGRVSEIGNILTLINEIADQTNLLALNAAIEAARAGEQGRGFAVVADEVRKLAERTINATAEISTKISAVQTESRQTTESMEKATGEVASATNYIKDAGTALKHIVKSVQSVRDQITHIATAVEEQSSASEHVTSNIEETSEIARKMEIMSDDVMKEVNTLKTIADELKSYTTGFKKNNLTMVNATGIDRVSKAVITAPESQP